MKHTLQKFVRGLSKVGHGPEMDTKKKTHRCLMGCEGAEQDGQLPLDAMAISLEEELCEMEGLCIGCVWA